MGWGGRVPRGKCRPLYVEIFRCTKTFLLMSMDIALFYKCKSDYTLSRVGVGGIGNFRRRVQNSSAQDLTGCIPPNPA